MEFNAKSFEINRTKNSIKTNNPLFLVDGVNKNSQDWVCTEQILKKINFKYRKVFNKIAKKVFSSSVYFMANNNINSTTFFIKLAANEEKNLFKNNMMKNLKLSLFVVLILKLNNKLYQASQLNSTNSLDYSDNKSLALQFSYSYLNNFDLINLSK